MGATPNGPDEAAQFAALEAAIQDAPTDADNAADAQSVQDMLAAFRSVTVEITPKPAPTGLDDVPTLEDIAA